MSIRMRRLIERDIFTISSSSLWLRRRMDRLRETDHGLFCELERENLRLMRRLRALEAERDALGGAIERVPDARTQALLRMRYLECLPWQQIGERLHLSRAQLWRIHKRALGPGAGGETKATLGPGAGGETKATLGPAPDPARAQGP